MRISYLAVSVYELLNAPRTLLMSCLWFCFCSGTDDVDEESYSHPQPTVGCIAPPTGNSMSLYTPIITSANNLSSSEYCYLTPSSLQHQASQPPVDVAEDGYLCPQPSVQYIASHQGSGDAQSLDSDGYLVLRC